MNVLERPKDIAGNEIEMGPWYWAMNRRGDVIGAGKFAVPIGADIVTFFINGTGYNPSCFTYMKHVGNPTTEFTRPKTEAVTATTCGLCGKPMPPGEEMFQYHGFSGPCPESA